MTLLLLPLLLAAAEPPAPDNRPPATYDPAAYGAKPVGAAQEDTPEEIAADSARDLKDSRYYNKPGASRADYDREWQECRLIARGSMTPAGVPVVVYNPAIISPAAAMGGGIIGGLIANAIAEGEQRRANRRTCLLHRGWRLVRVADADIARFAALPDAERERVFNEALGAAEPQGEEIISWTNEFAAPPPLAPAPAPKEGK